MQESIKKEAMKMWQDKSVRDEFCNDISILEAYLENKSRAKVYAKEQRQATKQTAAKTADSLDDTALKRKWESSKSLQDEFMGDYSAYVAYETNKGKVVSFG